MLHLQLEKQLADFVNKEAALTFRTSFQTNLGVISSIVNKGKCLLRTSYTATHTKEQLDKTLDIFEQVFKMVAIM